MFNLKKILMLILSMSLFSISTLAASYKVNTSGKITSPSGSIQQNSNIITPQNLYNNYNVTNYVNTNQAVNDYVATVDIVMDYSGSMAYWIDAAKWAMTAIVNQLPASTKIGLRVFGNDSGFNPYTPVVNKVKSITKSENGKYKVKTASNSYLGNTTGSCSATSQLVPVINYNSATLVNAMSSAQIGGSTPLTLALEHAVSTDFGKMQMNFFKKIILITDGGENCGGNPCAFAKDLVSKRQDITIDVVLVSSNSSALKCLAATTGGNFYSTNDVNSFANIMLNSIKTAPTHEPQTNNTQNYEFIKN